MLVMLLDVYRDPHNIYYVVRLVRQFILIQQSRVLLILIYRRQVVVVVVIPCPHRE